MRNDSQPSLQDMREHWGREYVDEHLLKDPDGVRVGLGRLVEHAGARHVGVVAHILAALELAVLVHPVLGRQVAGRVLAADERRDERVLQQVLLQLRQVQLALQVLVPAAHGRVLQRREAHGA